jgi:hypothetical protein
MNSNLLLPHRLRKFGWWILLPSLALGTAALFFEYQLEWLGPRVFSLYSGGLPLSQGGSCLFCMIAGNYTLTIAGVLVLISLFLIAFTREETEDEFIWRTRTDSLHWATYFNYFVLLICFLFFFDFEFLYVMIFNMYTTLVIYIVRFRLLLAAEIKRFRP